MRKEIASRSAKLASLKYVEGDIAAIKKEVTRFVMSVRRVRKDRHSKDSLARKREAATELSKEQEKSLHRNWPSVMKELARVKVGDASLRWIRGNVADRMVALVNYMVRPSRQWLSHFSTTRRNLRGE